MRVLVTGALGFVGRHAADALRRIHGSEVEIVATARLAAEPDVEALDVADPVAVADAIARHRPTHVLNLAGVAAPAIAGRDPDLAWRVHLEGARRLAAGVRAVKTGARLVQVGTGLAYGASFASGTALSEDAPLAPLDDYGASKVAAEVAVATLARRGLDAVLMRPFNHAGPGQGEDFVVSAFAAQIARIEVGAEPLIRVGDLDAERDFLDVRDVCEAYALAMTAPLVPGTALNLASGRARRIGDVLEALLSMSQVPIRVEKDPNRLRPSEVPRAVGDAARARELLGWEPRIPFEETLRDTLEDWRGRRDLAIPMAPCHRRGDE